MAEPIGLHYDLHLMPRGRVSFRRWHWELWDGPRLCAAGWQTDPLAAQRTIRTHAVRVAHRHLGLRVARPDAGHPPEEPWRNRPITFTWGAVEIALAPLNEQQVRLKQAAGA